MNSLWQSAGVGGGGGGSARPKDKDTSIVKIAVEFEDRLAQLISFNQEQPLATIIKDLCSVWDLAQSDQYALQFSENNYVTEKNRNEIKNGDVLRLALSPVKTAQCILHKMNNGTNDEKTMALQKLSKLSADHTFAQEFINKQGLALIISTIEQGKCQDTMLAYCLLSFVELMDHGIVSWDILENTFINIIAGYVNNHSKSIDSKIVQSSLTILENIIVNSSTKCALVEKETTLTNLVAWLENQNAAVQQNVIALINAIFLKADYIKRKSIAYTLWCKPVRNTIYNRIIESTAGQVGVEMAHQLYVMQTLYLGLLEMRMNSKIDAQDPDSIEKIKELRRIAFEVDGNNGMIDNVSKKQQFGTLTKDHKKLGFRHDANPVCDFLEVPPGLLALDCMYYFAKNHVEQYTKVVLENSCRADEHECPFGKTSIELVKLLCQVLQIGDAPGEQNIMYQPMFFAHDRPFEEFYSIGIQLLNKTWKEMRATTEDLTKVFSVVREQIVRALNSQALNFEKFKQKLQTLTYTEITNLWQQERTTREEWESHAKPIVQLKEIIQPEIINLIQKQRLCFLIDGTRFVKCTRRVKDKFWYVRLSPNHKYFHYGDCDDKSSPLIEELPNKLAVIDIKSLVTGKDCPHMKDVKIRKTTHHLAFSLMLDSTSTEVSSLDFVAPDEITYAYWTDGMSALLGLKMSSKEAENDLETLLSMEIKLRLLDAEGINIPQDPPEVPPDPPNYDFELDK